jgi:hypothetical protein
VRNYNTSFANTYSFTLSNVKGKRKVKVLLKLKQTDKTTTTKQTIKTKQYLRNKQTNHVGANILKCICKSYVHGHG